jgi:catechol 2,3-dioxygenase
MIRLLAHLAHLEVVTPDLDASVRFYEDRMGMRVVAREGDSVFLRCWGDYYTYSLIVTRGAQPALAHMAWRTTSPEALEEAARRVEAAGVRGEWRDPQQRHGRAYRFTGPYGHVMELFWDVEKHRADGPHRSQYPDRPSRRTNHGVAPRFLDHVTVAARDVRGFAQWYRDTLGFRVMAYTSLDHAPVTVFGVLTTNEKSHDLGVVLDGSGVPGRVNHIAFWVDTREEHLVAADVLLENGTPIEYGPSIHGIGEQTYLYFREPSGLRVELNTGGYRNYVPDWEPYDWKPSQGSLSFYRNAAMPDSMTESFPPAPAPSATEEGALPGTEDALAAAVRNPFAKHGQG